jgi:hypothetical protein
MAVSVELISPTFNHTPIAEDERPAEDGTAGLAVRPYRRRRSLMDAAGAGGSGKQLKKHQKG